MRIPVRFIVLVTASAIGFAGAASAHARLTTSNPADGTSLQASPPTISLKFSEGLEPAFSHMTLTNQSGESVRLEGEKVDGGDASELSSSPATPLSPGDYSAKWDVLSMDGHKTSGALTFKVAP